MTRSELVLVAALVFAPAIAHAQDTCADPLPKLEERVELEATSGALLDMADCYEKLGRYASASAAFERAAALAASSDQAERAQEAKDRQAAVAPLVSHLTVKAPPGANVTIDGEAAASDEAKAVDGGEHVVRVEAHCRAPNESRVSVGLRADAAVVTMALGAQSTDAACGGPPPTMNVVSEPAATPSSWSTQKSVAVVLGATSLVALGAGVAFGLSASSKKDELAGACRDYPNGCPVERRDELETTYDDASRAAAYSTLGIIAGVVFLGAAVGLYLTAPKTARSASSFTRIVF